MLPCVTDLSELRTCASCVISVESESDADEAHCTAIPYYINSLASISAALCVGTRDLALHW